jgi:Holliday junction resolvase RusA-like endonuclease
MRELRIIIPGNPVAWARPGQSGKYRYDTQKSIKNALGLIIKRQLGNHKAFTANVYLKAEFLMPEPKTLVSKTLVSKTLKDTRVKETSVKALDRGGDNTRGCKSRGYHTKKPDIDNLLKFYLDLCKDCGVYIDDAQVCDVRMTKMYGNGRIGVILDFEGEEI